MDMKTRAHQWVENIFDLPKLWQRIKTETTPHILLMIVVMTLVCIGTTIIGSASMPYAARTTGDSFFFIERHGAYVILALIAAYFTYRIPTDIWFKHIFVWLFLILILLSAVLMFGADVNGSTRWIRIPIVGLTFQPSELAKFVMVAFTADFVVRRADEIRYNEWTGFLRLCIPMGCVLLLVMLEPDLGASAVIVASMMTIFFLAGAPLKQFVILFVVAISVMIMAIVLEPYRLKRITSFLNPWKDQYGDGYQLAQSLIAFWRGEWTGVGLGHSIQKLAYLPEAHTDFLLAIYAEEMGFFSLVILFLLLTALIMCAMKIGYRALLAQNSRAGFLAYGIAAIFLVQFVVNAGMNMGLLPTKGLTLPFISYGGTSLVVCMMMVGVLLRIDYETRYHLISKI